MTALRKSRPLDSAALEALALRYVERYATTRAKLSSYLKRKLRERGWAGEDVADVAAIVEKMARLRYVDDASFADMRARGLLARGYGARRVDQALMAAGVEEGLRRTVSAGVDGRSAALAYARRRRFGAYAGTGTPDPVTARRQLAAMLRAGHSIADARHALAGLQADEFWDDSAE